MFGSEELDRFEMTYDDPESKYEAQVIRDRAGSRFGSPQNGFGICAAIRHVSDPVRNAYFHAIEERQTTD